LIMSNEAAIKAARLIDEAGWIMHRRREGGLLRKGEWALLRFLNDAAPNPVIAKQFAAYYAVAPRHASAVAADLEVKGLVRRFWDAERANSALIEFTSEGRKTLTRDPLRALAKALDKAFDPEALEDLCVVLTILLKAFVDAKLRPRANHHGDLEGVSSVGGAHDLPAAVALLASEATESAYQAGFTNDLKRNEWTALRYYFMSTHSEPTATMLALELGVNHSLASQATIALSRKRLVERKPSQKRHNAFAIVVTEKGEQKLHSDPLARLENIMARTLSGEDNARVAQLMETVIDSYDPAP
jgi:DNA-binding MarR family transcriptional regulator